MKPTKSVCHNGIVIELLTINGKFYVRKRVNGKNVGMTCFATEDQALQYFSFIRG